MTTATLESVRAKFDTYFAATAKLRGSRVAEAYRALRPEARAALKGLRFELKIVQIAADDLAAGKPFSKEDHERLLIAIVRIARAEAAIYGRG